MKKTTALLLFTALFFAGRPVKTGYASASVEDDIHKVEGQMKVAMNTGDSALFLNCYAPDASIMAPNAPTLSGQQGVLKFFKNIYYQIGVRDAIFTHLGLYGQTPEFVTQHGAFEVFNAKGASVNKGKVLIVWKKTDVGWRIYLHMLNFDAPIPK
ncbi:YybH family protein [Dinghuibacter silviterrae]|uniref:Ketosteroid isomerase-like protein n=1 Tax=Dinghuibacter silviterrae TaxID=1539049 RepID=A0A4R8DUR7_9BACT|nr:DUF4440 domain-containing protein [Dinghuibacter silviterrae]TDX02140.1 ketosteroid isomerase-like protein [Dinghuibacter silviterrae]